MRRWFACWVVNSCWITWYTISRVKWIKCASRAYNLRVINSVQRCRRETNDDDDNTTYSKYIERSLHFNRNRSKPICLFVGAKLQIPFSLLTSTSRSTSHTHSKCTNKKRAQQPTLNQISRRKRIENSISRRTNQSSTTQKHCTTKEKIFFPWILLSSFRLRLVPNSTPRTLRNPVIRKRRQQVCAELVVFAVAFAFWSYAEFYPLNRFSFPFSTLIHRMCACALCAEPCTITKFIFTFSFARLCFISNCIYHLLGSMLNCMNEEETRCTDDSTCLTISIYRYLWCNRGTQANG